MSTTEIFDYVIAGGGSAGCLIAARLIEQGCSVCLIEAGPDRSGLGLRIPAGWMWSIDDPSQTWRHQTAPVPALNGRSILIRQGRVTGGTAAMNGLVYVRGQAADYDGWRDSGLPGWSWDEVRPYFDRAERYVGLHPGPRGRDGGVVVSDNDWPSDAGDAFIAAAESTGLARNATPNNGENEGVGYYERMISHRWRSSGTYITFLRKYRKSSRLSILPGHTVDRVVLDNGRATGLEVRPSRDAPSRVISARYEVVLASGTFGTPSILMRSGIGPHEPMSDAGITPQNVLEGVGQNLQDHFSIRLIARTRGITTLNSLGRGPHLWLQAARWLLGHPSIVSISPALVYAFFRAFPGSTRADATIFFTPGMQGSGGKGLTKDAGITCGIYSLRPESRGELRVRSSDPFDQTIIQPNYFSAEKDRQTTVAAFRKAREIYAASPMATYITGEVTPGPEVQSDDEIVAFSRATGVTSHHPIGTARMGAHSDKLAVVDDQLRVIGVTGLRIADASVIPVMPSGNTLAPILMIAEKMADFLKTARK